MQLMLKLSVESDVPIVRINSGNVQHGGSKENEERKTIKVNKTIFSSSSSDQGYKLISCVNQANYSVFHVSYD